MNLDSYDDYVSLLFELLNPLKPFYSKECARVRFNGPGAVYDQNAIEMEAFARPLWGLSALWKGGYRNDDFHSLYCKGIINGTDPSSPEYWGNPSDNDQRFVEMAPIAVALLSAPDLLWNPLSMEEKESVAAYLRTINEHELPKCNWFFFRILVNTALKTLGMDYSSAMLESDFDFIESCYIGDGWYKDGISERRDYYTSFAMHFYSLLYSVLTDDENYREKALERAEIFARDFAYWFTNSGEALCFGRSLTYRFAQSAFWSIYIVAGGKKQAEAKGYLGRNIRSWMEKDIFDNSHILTVGYEYPDYQMAENYNAPGSPYWALKSFAVLMLGKNDDFWNKHEEPASVVKGIRVIEKARMVIQHLGNDTIAFVPGMLGMVSLGHFTEKYDKFAYSAIFPFSVSHSAETVMENAPDSMLAFVIDDTVFVRKGSIEFEITANGIRSLWSPHPSVKVNTEIVIKNDSHIRIHEITSEIECVAYDSGFSIGREGCDVQLMDNMLEITNGDFISSATLVEGEGECTFIESAPNSSLRWRNALIPSIRIRIGKGMTRIITEFRAVMRKVNA